MPGILLMRTLSLLTVAAILTPLWASKKEAERPDQFSTSSIREINHDYDYILNYSNPSSDNWRTEVIQSEQIRRPSIKDVWMSYISAIIADLFIMPEVNTSSGRSVMIS